jgi:Kef-type K+ transport system membrane component KefB
MPSFLASSTDATELVTKLVIQIAIILIAAKLGGEICQRYIRIPAVLGELTAGVIIGPYLLGGVHFFGLPAIFPLSTEMGTIPVSSEIWSLAQIGSIVLLFFVGLETNLSLFMKYAGPAILVAIGGVLLPFFLGVVGTTLFGPVDSIFATEALFMGAILTATSVGITARVLSEMGALHSGEGVTILAAAVIDDILGILILTIVIGISAAGVISAGGVMWVGFKAIGFWIALTAGGLIIAPHLTKFMQGFKVPGAPIALFLALALIGAGLAESFGLALIIGAYSMGLALSKTDLAHKLIDPFSSIYNALVPIFFVVMGMLVDISAMKESIILGIVITILAIISKVVGSGVPSVFAGFSKKGALRIGVGMMPRGEVALIIAGVGLSTGVIGQDLFGVSIVMTVVTSVLAPIILVALFRNNSPTDS